MCCSTEGRWPGCLLYITPLFILHHTCVVWARKAGGLEVEFMTLLEQRNCPQSTLVTSVPLLLPPPIFSGLRLWCWRDSFEMLGQVARGQHASRDILSPQQGRSGSTSICRRPSSLKWLHNSDLNSGASGGSLSLVFGVFRLGGTFIMGALFPILPLFPEYYLEQDRWMVRTEAGSTGSICHHGFFVPYSEYPFVSKTPSLLYFSAINTAVVSVCLIPLLSGAWKSLFQAIVSPLLSLLH